MSGELLIRFGDDDARAARWEKKRLRFGAPIPVCSVCGTDELRTLHATCKSGVKAAPILCANDRLKRQPLSAQSATNKRRRFVAAGYPDPVCFLCGESDVRALELQHVSGRANSSLVVPYCGNCHAIASDTQGDLPRWLLQFDPTRRPLLLQAAFDFGLAIVSGALAIDAPDSTRTAFWTLIAGLLVGWAVWNIAADGDFAKRFGPDYSAAVPALVPG